MKPIWSHQCRPYTCRLSSFRGVDVARNFLGGQKGVPQWGVDQGQSPGGVRAGDNYGCKLYRNTMKNTKHTNTEINTMKIWLGKILPMTTRGACTHIPLLATPLTVVMAWKDVSSLCLNVFCDSVQFLKRRFWNWTDTRDKGCRLHRALHWGYIGIDIPGNQSYKLFSNYFSSGILFF